MSARANVRGRIRVCPDETKQKEFLWLNRKSRLVVTVEQAENNVVSGQAQSSAPLRMVTCPCCGARLFLRGDLPPLSTTPCSRCQHPVMIPLRLRQFELRVPIASGGMGTVYRAWDTVLERDVAIKLIKPEVAEDVGARETLLREARVLAKLNHTNIIHIYTFDEHEGHHYLVMELADQGTLDDRIAQGPLDELFVLDIGIKLASALDAALKHGFLHRDIKPANILFNADDEPKLIDFGLASRADEKEEEGGDAVWGTPFYIAPEKVARQGETFLSDMYSLAATLYHALTGRVPFDAPTVEEVVMAHLNTPVTPPNMVNPNVSQPTSDAIVRAMAKNPEERFQSYDEFIMALTAARSQLLVNRYIRPASGGEKKGGLIGWFRKSG